MAAHNERQGVELPTAPAFFERAGMPESERVHGRYDKATLYADELVVLSQIRPGRNSAFYELKETIRAEGLMNQIDTVHVNEAELEEFIEFTNSLWDSDRTLADFDNKRQADGTYYIVNAGFSRLSALQSLEADGPLKGLPRYEMDVKVHKDKSIEAYLRRQVAENIKSNPPLERRAMAIVEYYYWGIKKEKWTTQKDFLSYNDKMSKDMLSEALAFANLPKEVRTYVLEEEMSFGTAIQLGKATPVFEDYIYFKANVVRGKATKKQLGLIEKRLRIRLIIEANHLVNKRLNITAAEKRLRSMKETLMAEMAAAKAGGPEDEVALIEIEDLNMYTPEQLLAQMEAQDTAEFERIMRSIGKMPGSWAAKLIGINTPLMGRELLEKVLDDFVESSSKAYRDLGRQAAKDENTLI